MKIFCHQFKMNIFGQKVNWNLRTLKKLDINFNPTCCICKKTYEEITGAGEGGGEMKIDLTNLDEDAQIAALVKYHRNKYKNGINSGGNGDPYINTRCVRKRFIVSPERCEELLRKLIQRDSKLSAYVELNFL